MVLNTRKIGASLILNTEKNKICFVFILAFSTNLPFYVNFAPTKPIELCRAKRIRSNCLRMLR